MPTTLAKKLATPHVESPIFNQLFDVEHSYYSYAKEISSNGYTVIGADQLFPTSHFADKLVMEIRQRFQNKNTPKIIQDLNYSFSIVDEFNHHSKLLDFLEHLHGRKPFPFQTLHFTKGSEQHFHSDATHFISIPEHYMCGVWLAFGVDEGRKLK